MKKRICAVEWLFVVAAMILLAGCGNRDSGRAGESKNSGISGTVIETMNASRYTYIKIRTGQEERWIAVPQTQVQIGAQIMVPDCEEMSNFYSSTLNRTFEKIYFAREIRPHTGAQGRSNGSGDPPPAQDILTGTIIETTNVQRYTYILIQTKKDKVWVATEKCEANLGEKISVPVNMPMKNFRSPTLNRTFETIYFTGVIRVEDTGGSSALPPSHPPVR